MSQRLNFEPLTAEDTKANSLPPLLSVPIIADARLKSVVVEKVTNDWEIVDFNFVIVEDVAQKGHEFRYRAFDFKAFDNSEDEAADMKKWAGHLSFVLGFFIGDENARNLMNASDTWDEVRANITKAFEHESTKGWNEKIVKIKVLGYETTSGKAVLGFPRYLGFISDEESEHQVNFSRKERERNAKYLLSYETGATATNAATLNGEQPQEKATATEGKIGF